MISINHYLISYENKPINSLNEKRNLITTLLVHIFY